jgi:hypothetical protein
MYSIWPVIMYSYICYIFSFTCLSPSVQCEWTHLSIIFTPLCIVGKCLNSYAYSKEWCVYFETAVIVQDHYFITQLCVSTSYQVVDCIYVTHSGVCGPGSSVGIATDYGLDGLGIESW